jgi:dienelactone hydrolase
LAGAFAEHGIAALIYDKRGTGQSTGDWYHARLDELAGDALAGVRYLQGRVEVDADQVGLWGLSQGGWVVPLAAARSPHPSFIITVSAAGVSPAQQELYRWDNLLSALGYTERTRDAAMKAVRLQFDLDRLDLSLVDTLFLGLDFEHNPVPVLEQVSQPVLAIWGAADQVVPPGVSAAIFAEALERGGNQDVTIRTFAGVGHSLELVDERRPAEIYPPGYIETMVRWVRERTGQTGTVPSPGKGIGPPDGALETLPSTHLPWYGGAVFQLAAIALFTLLFGSTGVGAVLTYAVGWHSGRPPGARRNGRWMNLLAYVGILLNLALLLSLVTTLYQFLMADERVLGRYLELGAVRAAALAAPLWALAWIRSSVLAWQQRPLRTGRTVARTMVALAALAFVPFLLYWSLPW